jgi:hypothetical protein
VTPSQPLASTTAEAVGVPDRLRRSASRISAPSCLRFSAAPEVDYAQMSTSRTRTATRRSDGEGTLRAEPLRDALAGFERPATVISESPDEASHQAIRAVLSA